MRFHSDLIVKIKMGETDVIFESTTGVKQGCTEAPTFFNLYFQVANEVVDLLMPASSLHFKTKQDFVLSGRSMKTHSESVIDFSFDKFLYADDKAKIFGTRMDLENGMQISFQKIRADLSCGA